jgi:hypothetical protein
MDSQLNKPFEPTVLFQTSSFVPPASQELAAKIRTVRLKLPGFVKTFYRFSICIDP